MSYQLQGTTSSHSKTLNEFNFPPVKNLKVSNSDANSNSQVVASDSSEDGEVNKAYSKLHTIFFLEILNTILNMSNKRTVVGHSGSHYSNHTLDFNLSDFPFKCFNA